MLGFGGAAIGNLYRELDENDAREAVRESLRGRRALLRHRAVLWFRTERAAHRRGAARRAAAAGDFDQGRPPPRAHGPQDASVGREGYFSPRPFAPVFDYGYDSVMRSHAESLERLGVPRVDILLCHDIGRLTHGDSHAARVREFLDGGYRAMRELRDVGRGARHRHRRERMGSLRRAAASTASSTASCSPAATRCSSNPRCRGCCRCASSAASPSCAADRSIRESSPPARAPAQRSHYNYAAPPADVLERVRRLEACATEFAVPLQAAALQFPLGHPPSRAWSPAARAARRRATARRCSRIRFRRHSGARCASAASLTRARHCPHGRTIDSHQHFWRLDRGDYGWLTPAARPIYRDYLPEHLAPHLARHGISATILVQAAPTVAETRYLLDLAREQRLHRGRRGLGGFRGAGCARGHRGALRR